MQTDNKFQLNNLLINVFFIFIYFKGCKCFVDSVVRLIEQYLKENNLMKTLIMLQVNNTIEVILVKI